MRPAASVRGVAMIIQRLRPLFSGHGIQVEDLCAELAGRGIDASIITAGLGKAPASEETRGFRIRRLRSDIPGLSRLVGPTRLRSPIFGVRAFFRLWRERRRIDIVHVHTLTDALYTAWLYCRLRRIPLVFEMTLQGTDDPLTIRASDNRLRWIRWALVSRCDGYVAISEALAEAYRQAGLPPERLRVIPQGVDTERFAPAQDADSIRAAVDLPAAAPVLVFVGSLIERKGIDLLLAAWVKIHATFPDALLVLVGKDTFDDNPEAREFLEGHLAALPGAAANNLRRVGLRDNVHQYLQAADVFVFPSRREGFGTVMVEAMACGLPCVVAELPGITDTIFPSAATSSEPAVGIVVAQEDSSGLAQSVLRLLANPSEARSMGAAARHRAVGEFDFDRIGDAYISFYGQLAGARRSG